MTNREVEERTSECGIRHQFDIRFKLRSSAGHHCSRDTRTGSSQLALEENSSHRGHEWNRIFLEITSA